MSHYDNQFKYYQHYVYKPIIYRLTSSSVIMFSFNTSFRLWKKYSVIKYSKTYLKKKNFKNPKRIHVHWIFFMMMSFGCHQNPLYSYEKCSETVDATYVSSFL